MDEIGFPSEIVDCRIDLDTGHEYKNYYEIRYEGNYHGSKVERNWWNGEPTGIVDVVVPIKADYMWIQEGNYIYEYYCRTHQYVWEGSDKCNFLWQHIQLEFLDQFDI